MGRDQGSRQAGHVLLARACAARRGRARSGRSRATRPGGCPGGAAATAIAALLVVAIVVEGRGLPFDPFDNQAQPKVPPVPPSVASVPAPQLHLPAERANDNRRYLLWSTDGFPAIVNGRSSLNPAFTERLIERMEPFPDRRTVALLSRLGVNSVILHANRVDGTPWEGAARAARSPASRLTRRDRGDLVVYEIRSPTADAGRDQALGRTSVGAALPVAESQQRGQRRGHRQRHQGERRWTVAQGRDRVPGHAGADDRNQRPSQQRGDGRARTSPIRSRGVASDTERDRGGHRGEHRRDREPAVVDPEHREHGVLQGPAAELVGPGRRCRCPRSAGR